MTKSVLMLLKTNNGAFLLRFLAEDKQTLMACRLCFSSLKKSCLNVNTVIDSWKHKILTEKVKWPSWIIVRLKFLRETATFEAIYGHTAQNIELYIATTWTRRDFDKYSLISLLSLLSYLFPSLIVIFSFKTVSSKLEKSSIFDGR